MNPWLTLVLGAIMSLITGLITWWIARSRERMDETRRMQRELLTDLISNRYHLTGDPFTKALNGCAVVFAESDQVQEALLAFHTAVTAQEKDELTIESALLELIRAMVKHLGLRLGDLPDEFLLRPFNTRTMPGSRWG